MRTPDTHDPIDAELAGLTPLAPNPARAEAVRRRYRAHLARRAPPARRTDAIGGSWTDVAVPMLIGLFSAFYAAALLSTMLRIEEWIR